MKPITTEKAIMLIESQNILTFVTEKQKTKEEIKKEFEELFEVKVEKLMMISLEKVMKRALQPRM